MARFKQGLSVCRRFAAAGVFLLSACAGESIFTPSPLELEQVVLANPISIAASSARQRLYVVNSNNEVLWKNASFFVFDLSNPEQPVAIASVELPNFSGKIFLDEARSAVYIPNRKSDTDHDKVDQLLRIDIDENSPDFLKLEAFDSGEDPFGGFFDGNDTLFVAGAFESIRYDVNDLSRSSVVDLRVETAEGHNLRVDETRELALGPSGDFLFASNRRDPMLILNRAEFAAPTAAGETLLGTEAVDYIVNDTFSTRGMARDATSIYVIDGNPPMLRVLSDANLAGVQGAPKEISAASLQIAAIPLGKDPGQILIGDTQHRAYVSNTGGDDISVIDLDLRSEIGRISVDGNLGTGDIQAGDGPFSLALATIGGREYLYIANFYSNNISVADPQTLSVLASFPKVELSAEHK